MTTLVGGVSELFQGDLDLGRRVVERLSDVDLGPGVLVEDLHYGAVAVAQRLEELRPDTLVLVGAVRRDREPASITRTRSAPAGLDPSELQVAITDAVTGYVAIDLIVEVAEGLGALPDRTVTIEVEPVAVAPSDELSDEVAARVDEVIARVRDEVDRTGVHVVARELEVRLRDGHLGSSAARSTLEVLLRELRRADADGRWGATFQLRDTLVSELSTGRTSEGMDHADWGLIWGLIEELGRLERSEAARVLDARGDQDPTRSSRPSP